MVEIVLLFFLCKAIGDVITNKGRIPIGYQVLAVVMWLAGEMFAAIGYAVFVVIASGEPTGLFDVTTWIVGIVGGGIGGGCVYLIAQAMPPAADPTMQQVLRDYGGSSAAAQDPAAGYDSYEDYSNLSSAKYLQNYQQSQ
ncbi:MAG: hypothetical protein RIC55_18055 [Pirellulaceae bacterium]